MFGLFMMTKKSVRVCWQESPRKLDWNQLIFKTRRLSFRPLRGFASFLEAEFAAFFHSRIAREKFLLLQRHAEFRCRFNQGASNPERDRLGLRVNPTPADMDTNCPFSIGWCESKRRQHNSL